MTQQDLTTAPPPEPGEIGFVAPGVSPDGVGTTDDTAGVEVYEDYFGFNETHTFMLPDGKQYIAFKRMTEGDRARFQQLTTRDVTVLRGSGDAKMRVDPATERHTLFDVSVVDWNIMRKDAKGRWYPVPFSIGSPGSNFKQWLNSTNPSLVDELEKAIRKVNPWLGSEETVEDIDKEMDRLRERREEILARERGEDGSATR